MKFVKKLLPPSTKAPTPLLAMFKRQAERELYSGHLYHAMASWARKRKLPNLYSYLMEASKEEVTHTAKFMSYIRVLDPDIFHIPSVSRPSKGQWDSVADLLAEGLDHEREISAHIAKLVSFAQQHGDEDDLAFLDWFTKEQVKEEEKFKILLSFFTKNGRSETLLDYNIPKIGKQ